MEKTRDIKGALYGSRLVELPHFKETVEAIRSHLKPNTQNFVEIGFDHGFRLVNTAQRNPDWQCLGIEVRKKRVNELSTLSHGLKLENLRGVRMDARIVFSSVLNDESVDVADVLFPTPWWDQQKRVKRLLFQELFVADLLRVLRPGGMVRIETDVEPYALHIHECFQRVDGFVECSATAALDRGPECNVVSRRQKKTRRDDASTFGMNYAKRLD